MRKLVTSGKVFYAGSMIAIGLYQLFYGEFNIMMMAPWPIKHWAYTILTYIGNLALIYGGIAMLIEKRAEKTSLVFGAVLLFPFISSYVPYELILEPYSNHLPLWTNALKEFAFAGGAFVYAGLSRPRTDQMKSGWLSFFEKFIPYGHAFFCITMISFGLMHLLYIEHVHKLVPSWIPFPVFWTGLTGIALIGSGLFIVARIKLTLVTNLLALMIFSWFLILHLPRAVTTPLMDGGNELTSAFSALIFAGTSLMIGHAVVDRNETSSRPLDN